MFATRQVQEKVVVGVSNVCSLKDLNFYRSVWVRTSVLDYGNPRKCLNAQSKCLKLGKICKSGD